MCFPRVFGCVIFMVHIGCCCRFLCFYECFMNVFFIPIQNIFNLGRIKFE